MTPDEFSKTIKEKGAELVRLVSRVLPVKIGRMAKDHFTANFRLGGFVDNTLEPWKITQRQLTGIGAAGQWKPLTSGRNHLMSQINYRTGDRSVTIYNNVSYASLHNEGGTTHPNVTRKMRRFAWAMFFANGGKQGAREADKWKAIALTKREKLNVKVPQRRFMGESQKLNNDIRAKIQSEIEHLLTL